MRPIVNDKSLDSEQTSKQIMEWIEHVYPIAVGKVSWDKKVSEYEHGWFCKFNLFGNNCESKRIIDIFDGNHMWRADNREHAFDIRQLAAGSILHIIQDAYSQSHVKRDNGKLMCMYTYDKQNQKDHCKSDAALEKNKDSLLLARTKSKEFIFHWKEKHEWVQVEPFFKNIFLPEESSGCGYDSEWP